MRNRTPKDRGTRSIAANLAAGDLTSYALTPNLGSVAGVRGHGQAAAGDGQGRCRLKGESGRTPLEHARATGPSQATAEENVAKEIQL